MTVAAEPLVAAGIVAAIDEAELTHVVTVPDTNQRTVLEQLEADPHRPLMRAATEDDVFAICLGLWIAGQRPLALVQQLGLFAGANALRAITHELSAPLAILAGLYGRDVELPPDDRSGNSAVRLCTPFLDALEVRWTLLEGGSDAGEIAVALNAAFDAVETRVVLLGAPTS
jgi:sulfopyruvate decarboxylase TPP-binding subunit